MVTDDYRWLHKKQSPEVTAYLNAENAYTEAMTADIAPLSEKLFAEIKGRMQEVDLSVPLQRGNYYYYSPFEAGKQYAIKARRPAVGERQVYDESAPEEILLNQNVLAEGQKYFQIATSAVSPDDGLIAYTLDTTGFRQFDLHVKDIKTGKLVGTTVPRVTSVA